VLKEHNKVNCHEIKKSSFVSLVLKYCERCLNLSYLYMLLFREIKRLKIHQGIVYCAILIDKVPR